MVIHVTNSFIGCEVSTGEISELTVDGEKARGTTATLTKGKKRRRMSKDLNAKNYVPHMLKAFQKEWPLSNDDKKIKKSSRSIKMLWTTFQ
jgi:hypothetical protein